TTRMSDLVPQGGAAASISGQFIYLAGGSFGSTNHYRYDILGNTWAAMAPVPVSVYFSVGAALGGKTYLVGGGSGPCNGTYIYDIATNTWSTGPNTNVPHSWVTGALVGNSLVVVAGYDCSTGDTNTVEMSVVGVPCGTPTPTATPTATATGTPTCTPGGTPGPWTIVANYPTTVESAAVASDGTYAYSSGGYPG